MKKIFLRILFAIAFILCSYGFVNGCRESYVRSFCSNPIGPYGFNENLYCKETRQFMSPIDWWDNWKLREHISTEFYFEFSGQILLLTALLYLPLYFLILYFRKELI